MTASLNFEVTNIAGILWNKNGTVALSGEMFDAVQRLDRMFLSWAAGWCADEYMFPSLLPAAELAKIDYLHSFPHLATFPATLESSEQNLERFREKQNASSMARLQLSELAAVSDVLTPAACYHCYVNLQGQAIDTPRYLTTRCICFRRESEYNPLQRQWNFNMREIVCLGSAEQVKHFLRSFQVMLAAYFGESRLNIEFQAATDPFFQPLKNPRYIAQKLEPVKTEMLFDGKLAIGSINFHRDYFGEAFGITSGGAPLFSGCVAFGLERWLYALLNTFGTDTRSYPIL